MSWKFVYNSFLSFGRANHIDDAFKIAKIAGYKFFTFNNDVYFIPKIGEKYEETGLTVEDLV